MELPAPRSTVSGESCWTSGGGINVSGRGLERSDGESARLTATTSVRFTALCESAAGSEQVTEPGESVAEPTEPVSTVCSGPAKTHSRPGRGLAWAPVMVTVTGSSELGTTTS
jgi:hypothetical protein